MCGCAGRSWRGVLVVHSFYILFCLRVLRSAWGKPSFGSGSVPGGGGTVFGGSVGCVMWLSRSPLLFSLAFFDVVLLAFSFLCCADGLFEVFPGFFSLLLWVRVGPVESEVVRGAVRG